MTYSKKLSAFILIAVMIACIIPVQVFAAKENGWEKDGNDWYYFEDGVAVRNAWRKSGGKWYYFGSNGSMWTNASVIEMKNGKYTSYIVDKSGAMVTKAGWYNIKATYSGYSYSDWHYLKKGGLSVQGWKKISGKWYYFGNGFDYIEPGLMYAGWGALLDGKIYVFSNSGALVTSTGWYKIKIVYDSENVVYSCKWYCFDSNSGIMFRGEHYIDGKYYYFDDSGACLNPYD